MCASGRTPVGPTWSRVRTIFTARVDPRSVPAVGSRRELAVDTGRLHFFDPVSGLALAPRAPDVEVTRAAALTVE